MAGRVPNATRDGLLTAFRYRLCQELNIIPFRHQAEWWAASDGAILLDVEAGDGMDVVEAGGEHRRCALAPRPGGRARVLADLGSFKIGKSYGAALWTSAFAAIPGARVQLVGIEYDICAPEFEYICEFLLSERGMGLPHDSLQNRPRDGRMWLDMPNGARFEARSWERKDSMKGKEIDAYVYCEAYMLPGLECYTSFSQNLRARDGYAVFATTPDRPWVKDIHNAAHSGEERFSAWHCTCSVPASVNPFTYSADAEERDKTLMTRDKFQIHYMGQLGDFVGRVYEYQRGACQFSPDTHPDLWRGHDSSKLGSRDDLTIPAGWDVVGGADTGTYTSALLVAFSPDGDAFVLDEFPNYKYTSSEIELDETLTIPEWAAILKARTAQLGGRFNYYADKNSQFKTELRKYEVNLLGTAVPVEARTNIAREYFVQNKIHLAPWLSILPFELENAQWPDEATAAGRFSRVKDRDHTLDCLEHILSLRPRGRGVRPPKREPRWIDQFVKDAPKQPTSSGANPHLGRG